MRKIKDPTEKLNMKTVVALGCFDGVHAAHARVIGEAVKIARNIGCSAAVWCFSEPPKNCYLEVPVPLICDSTEKTRLIRMLGADIMIEPDFTREISRVSADDFVKRLLCECAGAVHLVCGRSYTFGDGGKGNTEILHRLCRKYDIGLSMVEDVSVDGVNVSSTLVRDAVSNGQCVYAAKLLGRNFSICFDKDGEQTDTSGCGRTTFSVNKKYLCPCDGDYGVIVYYGGYKKKCNAHIMKRNRETVLLLNSDIDVTGRVRVEFITNKSTP